MDASALRRRDRARRDVWPRRRRHEGRHRLLRRRGGAARREARRAQGLGVVPDHRRRGRAVDQRHGQAARLGGRQGRSLGRGDRRRADQSRAAWRHDQDRAARLAVGRDHRQRPPGPFRLSASGRQSAARADAACRRAAQAALRRGHQRFSADQSRGDVDRCRQPGGQRNARPRQRSPSTSASTTPGPPRRCRPRSTTGWTGRHAARHTAKAARSRSTTNSSGAAARAPSS